MRRKSTNSFLLMLLKVVVLSMFGVLVGLFGGHLVTTNPTVLRFYNEVQAIQVFNRVTPGALQINSEHKED